MPRNVNIPEEAKQLILSLDEKGLKSYNIAKEIAKLLLHNEITPRVIRRFLKKTIDKVFDPPGTKPIDPKLVDIWVQKYDVEKINSEVIAEEFGVTATTVCRHLQLREIQIRPGTENKVKYWADVDFFETIDTPAKAYWLGWMYADGNVHKKGATAKISLKIVDKEILQLFSNYIYGCDRVDLDTKNEIATIRITRQKFKENLIKQGCPPDKCFLIRFPTFLSDKLISHFLRGYFDGDGCISIKEKGKRFLIDITSNEYFIDETIKYLQNKLNIFPCKLQKKPKKKKPCNTAALQFSAIEDVKNFYDWVYQDCEDLRLERKYQRFQQFLKRYEEYKKKYMVTEDHLKIEQMLKEGKKISEIAEIINRTKSAIRNFIYRKKLN